jgi:hypothetical protein
MFHERDLDKEETMKEKGDFKKAIKMDGIKSRRKIREGE